VIPVIRARLATASSTKSASAVRALATTLLLGQLMKRGNG
jgi:hypothetical protein